MAESVTENRVSLMLTLDAETRTRLWQRVVEAVESYTDNVSHLRIGPDLNPETMREVLAPLSFERPMKPLETLEFALDVLLRHQTHTAHPSYFGLYDPAPATMSILAETLVAVFNPQLSVWSQSPGAVEIEQLLVRAFGEKFGYDATAVDGTFTSGGAEANHTALLTALTHKFPEFASQGLRALPAQPVLYISSEGHHSILKAAKLCGLGTEAVREIEVDAQLRLKADALSAQIARDRAEGLLPFLIIATAGTTNAGIIDPLVQLGEIAAREGLWLHVDAAWGGAVMLVPELRHLLAGIEQSDSITFDPHKWLSVPRGAGLYLTRHRHILAQTFQIAAAYMPLVTASESEVVDQFKHSMQWSRRFTGLKLFLTLAVVGWEGYAEALRHHLAMGDYLRRALEKSDWAVVNDSSLAVLCFVDRTQQADASLAGASLAYLEAIREEVVSSGQAWLSITRLAGKHPALRACIVNYRTEPKDVDVLVDALNRAREKCLKQNQVG